MNIFLHFYSGSRIQYKSIFVHSQRAPRSSTIKDPSGTVASRSFSPVDIVGGYEHTMLLDCISDLKYYNICSFDGVFNFFLVYFLYLSLIIFPNPRALAYYNV